MTILAAISERTGTGWARPLTGLAMAVAVCVIAASAARLVWMLVAGADAYIRVTPPASATGLGQANLDYSILSRVTPFRSAGMAPGVLAGDGSMDPEPVFSDVEETTLDLILHGLILENEDGGHAFISTNGGVQTAYAVGDEIDGARGVTLDRIRVDSVLLRRNGELESLTYRGNDGAITTLTAVDSLEPVGADEDGATAAGDAQDVGTRAIARVNEDGAVEALSAGASAADGADTGDTVAGTGGADTIAAPARAPLPTIVRRLSRSDLETLALSIRLEENQSTEDGGLYVFPTGNIDIFAKSGLEAGDIITDVAGLKLDSRADFDRLLQEVEQDRQVSLVLVRGEDTRTLRVTIID